MIIKNVKNGEVFENIKITQPYKIYSTNANEAEVETIFEEYLKMLGYNLGIEYTKRSAKKSDASFPSKTGKGEGYPDYLFYNKSDSIIAIADVKHPDEYEDMSMQGLSDCTEKYLRYYNERHENKIKIAIGYDGLNFIIKYLSDSSNWEYIFLDGQKINAMLSPELLNSVARNGNIFTTQIDKNIEKEKLEPYFARCDSVFRTSKNGLSAIDKATEISILIFLKIFSNDGSDEEFVRAYGESVWQAIQKGKVDYINKLFRDFLNKQYQNIFPEKLLKVDSQVASELAHIIDSMFTECKIDRMTDVKGNALEYYQKASKDRKIGEFFTPRHLIRFMMEMVDPEVEFEKHQNGEYKTDSNGNRIIKRIEKIYDPACGSGGFLIQTFIYYLEKYQKYGLRKDNLKEDVLFGNELKDSTVMLTKLNMILLGDGHNHISNENSLFYVKTKKIQKVLDTQGKSICIDQHKVSYRDEACGTTTKSLPYYENNPLIESVNINNGHKLFYLAQYVTKRDKVTPVFEFSDVQAVNPKVKNNLSPFFGAFDIVMANHPYGLEEPTCPDALFLKHMFEAVREGGRISCIVGETLLFHKDYKSIREFVLKHFTIEAIISLPQGVFNPYTDVKTSILFMKKTKNQNSKTWLVDLKNDGFDLNLTRTPIIENDIPKTLQLWERWGGYNTVTGEYRSYHKEEKGFAEFHTLDAENWCVKRYITPFINLNSRYQLKPLSQLLKRHKYPIDINDDKMYKQITIQMWNRGIVLRENQYGKDIGTKKQFLIKEGQFLISKIDARNGAYGIVPQELNDAIITGNFWAFDINEKEVLPQYLTYLMRHQFFNHMCDICSYGSTNRWYLDENAFNSFHVPIPTISEQREILIKIEEHKAKISIAQNEIASQEEQILAIIDNVVGSN